MKIIPAFKSALILCVPFLMFLFVLDFAASDNDFFTGKFEEYKVHESVSNPNELHRNVIDYIRGKNVELSSMFNERESKHLLDVRNLVNLLSKALFVLLLFFIGIISFVAMQLKGGKLLGFLGKIFTFGGTLTILLSIAMLVLVNTNFQLFFSGFHETFFESGTYLFDPSSEMLVRLYPEQIFADIGVRISALVLLVSALVAFAGAMLVIYSKRKVYNHK